MRKPESERSIARVITFLSRRCQGYLAELLKPYDLTVSEQPFFMALHSFDGITQEELTALAAVDKGLTARVMKSLEAKKYIVRVQDQEDRRQNRIYATERAKQIYPMVKEALAAFNESLTTGIDPELLDRIYDALLIMEKNLS